MSHFLYPAQIQHIIFSVEIYDKKEGGQLKKIKSCATAQKQKDAPKKTPKATFT
jgi:hypothetical protein